MELLTSFVQEDFVKKLDYDTLERMDKSFVTREFKQKESDLIYKIKFNGKDVYIFLLIEFQSTVDKMMSFRMLHYLIEFYDHISKNSKDDKLPSVFPLLLYNGTSKWTAPVNIQDLIDIHIPLKYVPNFNYYKLVINELPKRSLVKIRNAVSAIFLIENSNKEELSKNYKIIFEQLKKEKPDIVDLFQDWLTNLLGSKTKKFNMTKITEVKNMLETTIKEIRLEGIEQGMEQKEIKIVLNANSNGISTKDIAVITGLTQSKVKAIIKKNKSL